MSTSRLAFAFVAIVTAHVAASDAPRLGKALTQDDTARVSFTVLTNGVGLPPGSGAAPQGEQLYAVHCSGCHGEGGENGINDRLVGGLGSIGSPAPIKTVGSYWPYATTLFDYLRRAMPYQAPGSLTDDELYALTAYILYRNGIVERDSILNAQTLPSVTMPNRENFIWAVPR